MTTNLEISLHTSKYLDHGQNSLLFRTLTLDGAVPIYVQALCRPVIPYLRQYSTLAVHPGEGRMYDTMRTQYHWPHILVNVYKTLKDHELCARTSIHENENE